MTGEPFGWGGLHLVPPPAPPEPETDELQRIADAGDLSIDIDGAEAERFRIEIERDARGENADWPDGS